MALTKRGVETYHGKPCRKCGSTERYVNQERCIACRLEYDRKRLQDPDFRHQKNAWRRKHYQQNIGEERERSRKYHRENKEMASVNWHRWYAVNREKRLKQAREHYQANREKFAEQSRLYQQRKPEVSREKSRRRRAVKKKANGDFSEAEFRALCSQYENKCLCCGRDDVALTADYIIPLNKGGDNDIDNIQPLCLQCNASKGDRHCTDYRLEKKNWEQLSFL